MGHGGEVSSQKTRDIPLRGDAEETNEMLLTALVV